HDRCARLPGGAANDRSGEIGGCCLKELRKSSTSEVGAVGDFMTLHAFLFWTIAATTGFCAVAVVVSQNIVRAATWLLFTLAGASGIFFLLGADLVGAIQLLIYVGGTLILVVFGVMLTAQGPFITMKTSAVEWAMSGVVGLVLLSVLAVTVMNVGRAGPPYGTVQRYKQKQRLSQDPATSHYSA